MKTSLSGWLFYLISPRDVKQLNDTLLRESWVGNVGQKAVKYIIVIIKYYVLVKPSVVGNPVPNEYLGFKPNS